MLTLVAPGMAGAALPNTNYPRTFHMWAGYQSQYHPRYDLLMGYGTPRQGAYPVKEIRSKNPGAILMMTPGTGSGTNWTHGNLSYGGGITGFPGGTDPELGYIAPFQESERVHNASGQSQRCANYARQDVAIHVAKIMAYEAKVGGIFRDDWDGVATDGWSHAITESWYCGGNVDLNRDGRVDDPETARSQFHKGLEVFADALHSYLPGKLIGGNGPWYKPSTWRGSDPNGWATRFADYSNYEHMEKYLNDPDSFIKDVNGWMGWNTGRGRLASVIMTALDGSNNVAPRSVSETASDSQRSCRWGLTLSLMTSAYYLCYPSYDHGSYWWMDEYLGGGGVNKRGYLGQPLGPPQKLANGVWRRDFQGGVALNNSTSATQTVAVGSGFRLIYGTQAPSVNTGAAISSVSLGPKDGRIVLRTQFVGAFVPPSRTPGTSAPAAAPPGVQTPKSKSGSGGSASPKGLKKGIRMVGIGKKLLSGKVHWVVYVRGMKSRIKSVRFYVDRQLRWTQTGRPFRFGGKPGRLDTGKLSRGRHVLAVRVTLRNGKVLSAGRRVTVR